MAKRFFAIFAAVLCVSCLCVTAFAETVLIENGVPFTAHKAGNYYDTAYIQPVVPGTTYTVESADCDVIRIEGTTASNLVRKLAEGPAPLSYTYTASDEYVKLTFSCVGVSSAQMTVTWTDPSVPPASSEPTEPSTPSESSQVDVLGSVGQFATTAFSIGSDAVAWIMDTPIALIGLSLFMLVALIGGIRLLIIL